VDWVPSLGVMHVRYFRRTLKRCDGFAHENGKGGREVAVSHSHKFPYKLSPDARARNLCVVDVLQQAREVTQIPSNQRPWRGSHSAHPPTHRLSPYAAAQASESISLGLGPLLSARSLLLLLPPSCCRPRPPATPGPIADHTRRRARVSRGRGAGLWPRRSRRPRSSRGGLPSGPCRPHAAVSRRLVVARRAERSGTFGWETREVRWREGPLVECRLFPTALNHK